MNDLKKVSVPICCICQKVINGDAEWIRTKRGTVLYMHRECVRKGKDDGYAEKKQKLQNAYGLKATVNDGMPKSNLSGDSTAQEAVRNAMMQEDIQLIEETARKASPEIYKWILRNVTEGTPYEWMDVPVGRRQFYEYRRYFFYLLAQKR